MTLGDYRGTSATPQPAANPQQVQPRARAEPQQLQQQQSSMRMRPPPPSMSMAPMGPPPSMPRSATANVMQQTPNVRMPPTPATHNVKPLLEEDSLFVDQGDPEEDEDQQWNPTEEDEEMLGWDSNAVYVRIHPFPSRQVRLTMSRKRTRELSLLLHIRGCNRSKTWFNRISFLQAQARSGLLRRRRCLRYAPPSSGYKSLTDSSRFVVCLMEVMMNYSGYHNICSPWLRVQEPINTRHIGVSYLL